MGRSFNKNNSSIKSSKTMKTKSGRAHWTSIRSRKVSNPGYARSAQQRNAYRVARRVKVLERSVEEKGGEVDDDSTAMVVEEDEFILTKQDAEEYQKHIDATTHCDVDDVVEDEVYDEDEDEDECEDEEEYHWETDHDHIPEEPESSIVVKFADDVFRLQNTYYFRESNIWTKEDTGECLVKRIDNKFYVLPCDVVMDYPHYLFSDEDWKWGSIGILKSVNFPENPQTEDIQGWFKEFRDDEMDSDDRAQLYD